MADDVIPDEIKQFILNNIDSIAQLEALLLLRKDPQLDWTIDAVAKGLYISEQETSILLRRLCAGGFLITTAEKPAAYRYHTNSNELGQMVDRLAELYSKYLIPVTNLIHSKPQTRVREFADAFKLRKEEDQ
jgi:hypothetical protein